MDNTIKEVIIIIIIIIIIIGITISGRLIIVMVTIYSIKAWIEYNKYWSKSYERWLRTCVGLLHN